MERPFPSRSRLHHTRARYCLRDRPGLPRHHRTLGDVEMKSEFVSAVSRELRTPPTSSRGAVELLHDGETGEFSPVGTTMVATALRGSERLTRVGNDIIAIERLEARMLPMLLTDVEVHPVVQVAVSDLRVLAAEIGVELVVTRAAGRIGCDSDRLVQALVNLIGNAIEFPPPANRRDPCGTERDVGAVRGLRQRTWRTPPPGVDLRALPPGQGVRGPRQRRDRARPTDHQGHRRAARRADLGRAPRVEDPPSGSPCPCPEQAPAAVGPPDDVVNGVQRFSRLIPDPLMPNERKALPVLVPCPSAPEAAGPTRPAGRLGTGVRPRGACSSAAPAPTPGGSSPSAVATCLGLRPVVLTLAGIQPSMRPDPSACRAASASGHCPAASGANGASSPASPFAALTP